ncbi:MAG: phosphoethanolamine transferase [Muribaculaceae bacterium]|nr:phosphoethanolamine transferase [Muribaculaceae bacterium]
MQKATKSRLQSIGGKFSKFARSLATPVVEELPFILIFIFLMGAVNVIHMMHVRLVNSLDPHAPSLMCSLGHIAIWFTVAYVCAALICKKRFLKYLFYLLSLAAAATQHFLLHNFGQRICATYLGLLAETNSKETSEFIHQYLLSDAAIPTIRYIVLYVALIIILEYVWKRLKAFFNTRFFYAHYKPLAALIVPILAFGLYSARVYVDIYKSTSPDDIPYMKHPIDPFTNTYAAVIINSIMESHMQQAVQTTLEMERPSLSGEVDDSLNVVLVIGESYIKWHAGIYGYRLNTTPHLAREAQQGRLFVFNDVVTPSNNTSLVLRDLLCCNNTSAGEQWYQYPYFPALFKQAGYDVFFWDNQLEISPRFFLYNTELSKMAYSRTNTKSIEMDGDFIEDFFENVGHLQNRHNLIIFHLFGQHHDASNRFPHDGFTHFTADSIDRNEVFITEEKKAYIASYDNATLYNDYVINKIIGHLSQDNTFLVYLSDHGEEVYDWRDQCARDHGPLSSNKLKYQYDIPFMVWCSDQFQHKHPEVVSRIRQAVNRPFMIDNLCHLLFTVGGINTVYYRDSLDLFSPRYNCKQRRVNNQDYDEIRWGR